MLDKKMYFSITLLMLASLFLFQLSGVSKQAFSDYTKNRFAERAEAAEETLTEDQLFNPLDISDPAASRVIWLGDHDSIYDVVLQWCTYRRYVLSESNVLSENNAVSESNDLSEDSVTEDDGEYENNTVLVLVEGSAYETYRDAVLEAVNEAVPVVFCGVPDTDLLQADAELRNLLGIKEIRGDVTLQGVRLQDGFFLGGAKDYVLSDDADEEEQENQDLDLTTPWYLLDGGTESYLSGLLPGSEYGEVLSPYLPALVWRHSTAEMVPDGDPYTSAVFAVSWTYLQDETGLGILTAIESKTEAYTLYPVINAQSFVLADFPSLSSENEERLMELYSRTTESVVRDIIWPGVETVLDRTGAVPSYMMVPFLMDASEVHTGYLDDYMQRIRETKGEAGISLRVSSAVPSLVLSSDKKILQEAMPDYLFASLYGRGFQKDTLLEALEGSGMSDIRTLVLNREHSGADLLSYAVGSRDGVGRVVVRTTGTADTHTFSEDLRMRSIETALGYSVLMEDLGKVLYPEDEDDEWQKLSEKFSQNTIGYWDGFETFDKTVISETGERAAAFLTGASSSVRDGDTIRISSTAGGTTYYVLRLYGEEPVLAEGGSFEEIEDGSWLITMEGQETTITVASEENSRIR